MLEQTYADRLALFEKLQDPTSDPRWEQLVEEELMPFYKDKLAVSVAKGGFGLAVDGGPSSDDLLRLAYPTFDRAVATDPKHLHRLPLSVNEKTGRIATPFGSLDGMPGSLDDMPLVNDPELKEKLEGPLQALQKALTWVHVSDTPKPTDVPQPVLTADWLAAQRRKYQGAMHRQADRVSVAPLRIDTAAAGAWWQLLMTGSRAPSVDAVDPRVAPIARKSMWESKDWRARLSREASKVGRLLDTVCLTNGLLHGETYMRLSGGRTQTHYPQLAAAQFFQTFAKETKHEVTGHKYIELDLSAAHLAVAWGAVLIHAGGNEQAAKQKCPRLCIAATDKERAREIVAQQNNIDPKDAKRRILMQLNQGEGNGGRFLKCLAEERLHMKTALREHPFIAGERLRAIQERVQRESKDELNLMFRALEGEAARTAAGTVIDHGLETVAFDSDCIFTRPTRALAEGQTAQQAIDAALEAVHEQLHDKLGIRMMMELEHSARWEFDGTDSQGTATAALPPIKMPAGGECVEDGDSMSDAGSDALSITAQDASQLKDADNDDAASRVSSEPSSQTENQGNVNAEGDEWGRSLQEEAEIEQAPRPEFRHLSAGWHFGGRHGARSAGVCRG